MMNEVDVYSAIQLLIADAIREEYVTADAKRIMLSIDDLIELGCATDFDKIDMQVLINKFNERHCHE